MHPSKGFTLVEAAVAAGVVLILAGLTLPLVLKSLNEARAARAQHDLKLIAAAIISQLKDTGCRPMAAGGPGGADGSAAAFWHSGGRPPRFGAAGPARDWAGPVAHNSFTQLFASPDPLLGNALFGLGPLQRQDRFRYRGPYLSDAAAGQADPWGNAYLILGYNERGQEEGGPIWVVCAGPDGALEPGNVGGFGMLGGEALPRAWDTSGRSADNIVLRVH